MSELRTRLSATVLQTPDPRALAAFYGELLGWPDRSADEDTWVTIRPPGGGTGISFQLDPDLVPPHWPHEVGKQQMHEHLDIAVSDLDAGVARAIELGARMADHQPQDGVRVMVDPDGHLFCLFGADQAQEPA